MSVAVASEPLAGVGDGEQVVTGARSGWVRRAEVALVLLVLPAALALAVVEVVSASAASGERRAATSPVLVVDGGGGPVGVERVLDKLRGAGVAARVGVPTGPPPETATRVVGAGSEAATAARVQRILGVGTSPSSGQLHYGTAVTVVVGKDVLER